MELQIEQSRKGPTEIELRVQVPAEEIAERLDQAVARIMREAHVPGFRPGRIPRRVVIEKYGKSITEETVGKVMQDAYLEALERTGVEALSPGEMDDSEYENGKPLSFSVSIEVAPDFELPNLSEITLELLQPKADEQDVLESLESLRRSRSVLVPVTDPIAEQSVIDVDLQELDESGLPLVGRSYRDKRIDLSDTGINEEFVTMMLGLNAGSTTRVESLWKTPQRGTQKPVKLQVKVLAVYRKEQPELDDEFAKSVNPEFATLQDLKADLRRYLEARAAYQARERMLHSLVDELLRRTDFTVPARMLDLYMDRVFHDGNKGHGGRSGHKHGPEELARFKEEFRAKAIWNLRWYLMRKRYVAEQMLEVTEDEYDAEIRRLAAIDGQPVPAFKHKLSEEQVERIRGDLLDNKVFAYLQSRSQIVPRVVSLAEFEGRGESRIITQ